MYWSGYDAKTNREMVQRAGFSLLEAEVELDEEDGVLVPCLWVFAKNAKVAPLERNDDIAGS